MLGVRTNHSATGGTNSQGRPTHELRSYRQTGSIRAALLDESAGVGARNSGNEIYRWKARFGVNFNRWTIAEGRLTRRGFPEWRRRKSAPGWSPP